jgi:hypothetical protein
VPWHNFVVWHTVDGGRYVTTELFHGAQEVTDADSVGLFAEVWERLWAAAAHEDEAIAMISRKDRAADATP